MTSQLTRGKGWDSNPFRPDLLADVGNLDPGLAKFLQYLVQTERDVHNLNMVGDTTLPWELMCEITSQQLYNLGSIGRFLNPPYGMIRARYVKFKTPTAGLWTGSPYGWAVAPGGFKWEATNEIGVSLAARVAGLGASYTLPVDGQYGWIIIEGINTQSIRYTAAGAPTVGQRLIWSANGLVGAGTDFVGTVVSVAGLVAIDATHWDIAPGCVHVSRPQ